MNRDQPASQAASTSEKLKELDQRRKRAISKAVGVAVLVFVLAFAVKAGLMSIRPRGTALDAILLVWDFVVLWGAPLAVGLWTYKKSR